MILNIPCCLLDVLNVTNHLISLVRCAFLGITNFETVKKKTYS